MAEPMTPFRSVYVEGPPLDDNQPLWLASLELGGSKSDPLYRNYSIRLLVQAAKTIDAYREAKKLPFHEPLALMAAVTARGLHGDDAKVTLLGKRFTARVPPVSADSPLYEDVRVVPVSEWPPRLPPDDDPNGFVRRRWVKDQSGLYEVAAPHLRATEGPIRVAYKPGDGLDTLLKIGTVTGAPGRRSIFGALQMDLTTLEGGGQGLVFDLTPEGVELEARVPSPFEVGAQPTWARVRLRLERVGAENRSDLRLALIGGPDADALGAALVAAGEEICRGESPLGLKFNPRSLDQDKLPVWPLSWPLTKSGNSYTCGVAGDVPAMVVSEEAVIAHITSLPDPTGGGASVARLLYPTFSLAARRPDTDLVAKIDARPPQGVPLTGPKLTLDWNGRHREPDSLELEAGQGWAQTGDIAVQLAAAWSATGALAAGERLPYAFVALERGWVQAPLSAHDPLAPATPGTASAIEGVLRLDLSAPGGAPRGLTDRLARPGLDVVAFKGLTATVKLGGAEPTVHMELMAVNGSLDGALWHGSASPTPADVLPPLEAGPAALGSLPIGIGGNAPDTGWRVSWPTFAGIGPASLNLTLDKTCDPSEPLLVWRAHPELALVAAMGMTRTAESATQPSATRELFPAEVRSDGAGERQVSLQFAGDAALPATLTATSQVAGSGRWNWPWPASSAPRPLTASPLEGAGVSMVSLTLPGVEFIPTLQATFPTQSLLASLRYDLPLMDELHANARAPKPASGARASAPPPSADPARVADRPPTALNPAALSADWREKARRRARAITEGHRVILTQASATADVVAWHPFETNITSGIAPSLIETWTWKPPHFRISASGPGAGGLKLGAYALGRANNWIEGAAALGGLSGTFLLNAANDTLDLEDPASPGAPGTPRVKVEGFAASSFERDPDRLHDGRGLALAKSVRHLGSAQVRAFDNRAQEAPASGELLTLSGPATLKVGATELSFWCRDLPVTATTGGFVFDARGGLESGAGPDPAALRPRSMPHALYEWRLHPTEAEDKPAEFEAPLLAPLTFRPLRLAEARFGLDGKLTRLAVIGSVQIAVKADALQSGPFAEDRAYASGNLVRLEFGADGRLAAIQRVAYDETNRKFSLVGTGAAPIEIIRRATVRGGGDDTPKVTVALLLTLGVSSGAPQLVGARLSTRLFGQDCDLDGQVPRPDAHELLFAGLAPSGALAVDTVRMTWKAGDSPELDLSAGVLKAPASRKVSAFLRPFGDTALYWLGLQTATTRETIDHESGALVITVEDAPILEGSALFRGFPLPDGQLEAVIAVTFTPKTAGHWPEASCMLAEFSFAVGASDGSKRVTRVRHRYQSPAPDGGSAPLHELELDATFTGASISAVRWPAGRVQIDTSPFASRPQDANSWSRPLTMAGAGPDLIHVVRPRLKSHRFPLRALASDVEATDRVDATTIRLAEPWRLRAVTDHLLRPADNQGWDGQPIMGVADGGFAWASVDEVCLWDMRELKDEAAHAFAARYRDDQSQQNIPLAGVVLRTLAAAGLPTVALLNAIGPPDDVSPDTALVLSGGTVIDVVTDAAAQRGLTLTPQWLLPWAAGSAADLPDALGPLSSIPQYKAGVALQVAAYDAAAGAPRRLSGPPAMAFAARDGDAVALEDRLTNLFGRALGDRMIADQSVTDRDPPDTLEEPLFLRTLIALAALLPQEKLHTQKVFPLATTCVVPGVLEESPRRGPPEARLAVAAWSQDDPPPAQSASPAIDLLVLDGERILARRLPGPLAATLADPSSRRILADGRARADAAQRALGLSAAPRIILLARVDPDNPGSFAEPATTPHVSWTRAPSPRKALRARVTATPQPEADTIFASPALGWPTEAGVPDAARAHAHLGAEVARRNADVAWAGRARSVAWPAKGLPGPPKDGDGKVVEAEILRNAVFVAMGQRTAFRRRAAEDFRSPPDRLSVLVPPRARAPTVEALQTAFKTLSGDGTVPLLAAILPGSLEVTVTGQRPGVLVTQHESLVFAQDGRALDAGYPRFGRPAARGPVVARQVRAPRSAAFSLDEADLDRRRATFVALDELAGGRLKTLKAVAGPAQVLRCYKPADEITGAPEKIAAVTLQVEHPTQAWLTSAWDGRIRLTASAASGLIAERMSALGLLPSQQNKPTPAAELRVGQTLVTFQRMTWGETIDPANGQPTPANGKSMVLEFTLEDAVRRAKAEEVRAALEAATADTLIQVTLRGRTPGAASSPSGTSALSPPVGGLIAGPPRVATFNLSHIPSRRRWLPRPVCTLVFADPAYDRELGSPAQTSSATLGEDTYVLGADRAEYDLGAAVHFAVWPRPKDGATPAPGVWRMILAVNSAEGGQRRLRLATPTPPVLPPPKLPPGDYEIEGDQAYAIAVAALREADGATPVTFRVGDRLVISVCRADTPDKALSLDLGIIDTPVLPPPSAVYGVVEVRAASGVGAPLFATAPLPTLVELPNLLQDLKAGHIRRRALFCWTQAPAQMPASGAPHVALVKNDRTGGGQQPSSLADFCAVEVI